MDSAHYPLVGGIIAMLVSVVPLWKIFGKAGFAPAWALLIFVPFFGAVAILLMLAFRRWPATGSDAIEPRA